ncbi:XdhC family protein [Saccharopolyspora sp. HNM0983]|uniref:XdhC family protein n=1 Tax=Saccharopolyspora montiporae TaxID=2781240 RepID=A0A929BFN4_9PSEU|nr:XdhC family protein [Saccharopolyspora sp. HNM0983]MBE9376572.1 XdhC family protein [Saccharopolyspora sp. HNM0983]
MSDESCAVAHGSSPAEVGERALAAVFAGPVAGHLLHFGRELGFAVRLVEPDPQRAAEARNGGIPVQQAVTGLDDGTDIVVTDHHRPELGSVLRDALHGPSRWIGVLGNPRHEGPHVAALRELGVAEESIARVHRPVGLNIGSRTPPEIALATLAGLIADRNGRPGGFEF